MIRENDSNVYFYNRLYQQFKVNENSELIEIKDWNKNNAYITVFNNLNIKKEGNYNVGKDYFYDIFDIKNTDIFKATEKDFYKIISETERKGLYYNETKISDYDDNAIHRKFLVEGRLCLLGKNKIISVYNKGKLERKYDLEKELNQTIEIEKVFVNQNRKKSTLCYKVQIFDIDLVNGQLKFTKNNFEIDYDRGLAKLEFNNKSNKTFIYTNANGFYVYFKSNFSNCTDCYQSPVHKFVNRVIKQQSKLVKYDYFKKINTKYNISHLDLFFNISEDTVCFIKGNQIVYAANNSEQKYTLQLKDFNQTNGNFSDALVFGKNVYLIRKNCLYELLGKNKLELKAELSKENLVTATRVKNENEWLLYYEKEGLFYYNFLNKKTLKIDFFKYKEVRKIAFDETINRYWIFSYGFGIYLMDEKFNVNPFFKDDNGYLFFAHYFLKDTRGNYWIATNNGLFKFDAFEIRNYMDNPNSIIQYDYYSKKDGIINNEFNGGYFNSGIKLKNGELAFSNMEGIVVLKTLDKASKDYNYPILIDDVKHNNKSIEKKDIYNFMEDSGPIEIMLSSPFYENSSNSVLECKISGINTEWVPLENNTLRLISLKQGEYIINIRKTRDIHPLRVKSIIITISPPWYKTKLAIFLYIIAILSLGAYVSRYFYIKNQKKLQSKLKLLESELKALRTQINPHYLSNSLISLQNSILVGNHDKSLAFISMFNKVMRNILMNSEKSKNSIDNELRIIKEYLNLENLNREKDIKLLINGPIDSNYLLEEIYIPTNILQPIIENSIIHGFSESIKKDLFISININIFETQLKIEIIDNGIGYHPLKTDRKSYGLKNIEMVLKNLELKYKQSSKFQISNRSDAQGTLVTIKLPLIIQKNDKK